MTIVQLFVKAVQELWNITKITTLYFIEFCNYIKVGEYVIPFAIKATISAALISITYAIIVLVRKWIKHVFKSSSLSGDAYLRTQKTAYYSILLIGGMIVLQNLGVQLTPIITLLGIIGVALGYALKDFISNIIAGLFIVVHQPFKLHDEIKIKDWQGKIIDITIRYTALRDGNSIIYIPNSILYTTTVAIVIQKETH